MFYCITFCENRLHAVYFLHCATLPYFSIRDSMTQTSRYEKYLLCIQNTIWQNKRTRLSLSLQGLPLQYLGWTYRKQTRTYYIKGSKNANKKSPLKRGGLGSTYSVHLRTKLFGAVQCVQYFASQSRLRRPPFLAVPAVFFAATKTAIKKRLLFRGAS